MTKRMSRYKYIEQHGASRDHLGASDYWVLQFSVEESKGGRKQDTVEKIMKAILLQLFSIILIILNE